LERGGGFISHRFCTLCVEPGEGDDVAGGVADEGFGGAVGGGAAFDEAVGAGGELGDDGVEVVDLDEEHGHARGGGAFEHARLIVTDAGAGLVHDFHVVLRENDEAESFAVRCGEIRGLPTAGAQARWRKRLGQA
jgi:hypothetical protein